MRHSVRRAERRTVIASDSDVNINAFRPWKSPSLDPRCQVNGGQSKHGPRCALILRREKSPAFSTAPMPLPDVLGMNRMTPSYIYLRLSLMCRFFRRRPPFRGATWTWCTWARGRQATGRCWRSPWLKPPSPLTSWRCTWWWPWWGASSKSGSPRNPICPTPSFGTKRMHTTRGSTACQKQWVCIHFLHLLS